MNNEETEPRPGKPKAAPRRVRPDAGPRRVRQERPVPGRDPLRWPEPEQVNDTRHPVVAGYDGSASSRHALAYAAGMARRLGRSLVLVYVVPGISCEPMTGQVIGATRDDAELTRWLLAELDQVFDRGGLAVSVLIRRGNAARELAAAADESSADALVVGAPEHAWHHVAGSVSGWLARHAHCPVIVVP